MRDRLGNFGDVVFGLMLAGVVAAYVALYATLIPDSGSEKGIALFLKVLWIQETPFIQFIAISTLWALQARVVSKLFVDHVAFVVGYTLMLLCLFGWVMVEGIIPEIVASQRLNLAWPFLVTSPSSLLSFSFGVLLILAIGGLAYHWFWLSRFKRYESIRDCSSIAIGLIATAALGSSLLKIQTPLDLMELFALVLAVRLSIAVQVDPWALKLWGTRDERAHQTRILLAGQILIVLLAVSDLALTWADPRFRSVPMLWLPGVTVLALSSWGLVKQISIVRSLREDARDGAGVPA